MNGFEILIQKAAIVLPREVSGLKKGKRAEVDFPKVVIKWKARMDF